MENIRDFLIQAKKYTYANASAEKSASSRQGSNDYEYSGGDMIYHDIIYELKCSGGRII